MRGWGNPVSPRPCVRTSPSQTLPPGGGMGKPGFPTPLREGQAFPRAGGWGNRVSPPPSPRAYVMVFEKLYRFYLMASHWLSSTPPQLYSSPKPCVELSSCGDEQDHAGLPIPPGINPICRAGRGAKALGYGMRSPPARARAEYVFKDHHVGRQVNTSACPLTAGTCARMMQPDPKHISRPCGSRCTPTE